MPRSASVMRSTSLSQARPTGRTRPALTVSNMPATERRSWASPSASLSRTDGRSHRQAHGSWCLARRASDPCNGTAGPFRPLAACRRTRIEGELTSCALPSQATDTDAGMRTKWPVFATCRAVAAGRMPPVARRNARHGAPMRRRQMPFGTRNPAHLRRQQGSDHRPLEIRPIKACHHHPSRLQKGITTARPQETRSWVRHLEGCWRGSFQRRSFRIAALVGLGTGSIAFGRRMSQAPQGDMPHEQSFSG